jgi:imidazolonepropionase-like amidohydrolase
MMSMLRNGPRLGRMILAAFTLTLHPLAAQTTVIQADRIMTSTAQGTVGPGFIVVEEGKIISVTTRRPSGIPETAWILHADFVAPGFIDARTTLGLSGLHSADDDRDETSGPNQAHLRALDAFDLEDAMVGHALRGGVTTVQAGPGDANSIGGQAGIFKLYAETVSDAVVRFPSAVVFSLDESAKATYGQTNRFPTTRMANVGLIRQALLDADRYQAQAREDDPPARSLKKEALAMVMDGSLPALISAERADELNTALRLGEEFGFALNIVGGADAQLVLERLAGADVPILLGPAGDAALRSEAGERMVERAARLEEEGIPFALVTGDDENASRLRLLDLARAAVRGGLSPEEALEAITIAPARILGVDDSLGSIEEGKDADMVLFDGDPLEASTRVLAVFVNGKAVCVLPGESVNCPRERS